MQDPGCRMHRLRVVGRGSRLPMHLKDLGKVKINEKFRMFCSILVGNGI